MNTAHLGKSCEKRRRVFVVLYESLTKPWQMYSMNLEFIILTTVTKLNKKVRKQLLEQSLRTY